MNLSAWFIGFNLFCIALASIGIFLFCWYLYAFYKNKLGAQTGKKDVFQLIKEHR